MIEDLSVFRKALRGNDSATSDSLMNKKPGFVMHCCTSS